RVEGMDDAYAGVEAAFLGCLQLRRRGAPLLELLDERCQLGIAFGRLLRQRMIGSDSHEGSAEDRVGAGREDFQFAFTSRSRALGQLPTDQETLRAAYPVRLHQLDLLRPAFQRFQAVQQVLAHGRYLEEPLGQVALLDRRT